MTFARRFKIISLLSVGLLLVVLALLMWSSGELKSAERGDELADDIQVIIFERATLRDEYYLHGVERARQQWLDLNRETERLLRRAKEQISRKEDQQILDGALNDFDHSVQIWQRLVEQTQRILGSEGRMVHSNEFASHLFSQIMLKDSALQQASALLQHTTRERYNSAQDRMIVLTFLLVLLIGMGTVSASHFMSGMLRSRFAALKHGTEIIASGDFGYRIPCNGADELAELAEAFNTVTQKVQEYTQALHESEERARLQLQELSTIYTLTPVGLFAVDRDLRYLRLNEKMAEFNCRPIQEHLGYSIDEVYPAGLVAVLREMWRPVLERGECILNLEMQAEEDWPSGLRHWLVSFQPLVNDAGAVIGLAGSVLDITERKVAEQVMAGAREQLELEVMQRTANLSLANLHLLQEIEVRKKVEVELLAQQQKLQEMALDVSMAEERERDRIASELHDQVGQRLILAKIRIDTLASRLPCGEYDAEAAGVETLIEQTIQDIRSLTFQIRPPPSGERGSGGRPALAG